MHRDSYVRGRAALFGQRLNPLGDGGDGFRFNCMVTTKSIPHRLQLGHTVEKFGSIHLRRIR
jgi:hypothetical protein